MSNMIPSNLHEFLPERETPWQISPKLFKRIQSQPWEAGEQVYKKCQLYQEDPEANFILKYFEQQKPANYVISNAYCIHTPTLTTGFEAHIEKIDRKAKKFLPEWNTEDNPSVRAKVIQRWQDQADQFYPITIKKPTREDTFTNVRVLPLWHGTSQDVCHSIASAGFTYFGKHHFVNPLAKPGKFKSTDPGYFGSGIYFTNSAKYASMYNSGNLIMAWVAMKQPFPVINDVPHPDKGSDMKKLRTAGAYQAYDTHFIPVAPISFDPDCMEYYPCYQGQVPACDEVVVFQEPQPLPRFWIELAVGLPKQFPNYPKEALPPEDADAKPTDMLEETTAYLNNPSLYSSGLNFEGLCTTQGCASPVREIYKIGLGNHNLARLLNQHFCSSCNKTIDLQKLIFWDCHFLIQGKKMDKKIEVKGKVEKDLLKIFSLHGSWSYLQIETKGDNHV